MTDLQAATGNLLTHLASTLINSGGPAAFLFFVLSPAVTFLALRRLPGAVANYARLVRLQPDAEATALAFVRGSAVGLIVLGACGLATAAAAQAGINWPGLSDLRTQLGSLLREHVTG